jgi:hypothetical protein
MSDAPHKPGSGLLGWLGRQIGYVRKAVKADVTARPPPKVVYRADKIEEAPHPAQPDVTLRRTTIDEVIVKKNDA